MTSVNVDLTVKGAPPVVIRVGVLGVGHIEGGVPATGVTRVEQYVLMSALPDELQRRVAVALDFVKAGQAASGG